MKEHFLSSSVRRERDYVRQYEYLVLTVSPEDSLPEARRRLVEHSEYGKWELERSRPLSGRRTALLAAAQGHPGPADRLARPGCARQAASVSSGPSQALATVLCADSSSEGWNMPASTSRYSRSSSEPRK